MPAGGLSDLRNLFWRPSVGCYDPERRRGQRILSAGLKSKVGAVARPGGPGAKVSQLFWYTTESGHDPDATAIL